MTDQEILIQIYNHVLTMNRELGGVQVSLDTLWKLMFLVLTALVINAGVGAYRQFTNKGGK